MEKRYHLGRDRRFISAILSLALFCVSTVCQAAAQNDCYGPSLELTIRSTFDPADDGYQISLPTPKSWVVDIGNSQNPRDVPCLEKPVVANSALHDGMHELLPDSVRSLFASEGVIPLSPDILALSADGITSYDAEYDWWMANIFTLETVSYMGHLLRPSSRGDAVLGQWLLVESHPDETGQRIRLDCPNACTFEYRLGSSLVLRYSLFVPTMEETPDWIAIDRAVRRTVLDWFL